MRIITYSDRHLEFGTEFYPPKDSDADVMILAGDQQAMITAMQQMHDYHVIRTQNDAALRPPDTITWPDSFVWNLRMWFEQIIVISPDLFQPYRH